MEWNVVGVRRASPAHLAHDNLERALPTKPRPEPTLRDQLAVARKLIDERHYDEALSLLRRIDHPTAREWETRVRQKQGGREKLLTALLSGAVVALLIAVVVLASLLLIEVAQRDTGTRAVVDAVSTWSSGGTTIARYAATESGARATLDALALADAGAILATAAAGDDSRATLAAAASATLDAEQRARLGGLDSPIPAGSRIDTETGALRILSAERPASYVLYRASQTGIEIAPPPSGTIYVGVELEFTCPLTAARCPSPPEADIALTLADGTAISSDPALVPRAAVLLHSASAGAVALTGGGVARGWRFFTVPTEADAAFLRVTTPRLPDGIYAALPQAVDGYALETAWTTDANGSRERRLPTFRRALEAQGFIVDEAILRQPSDSGARVIVPVPSAAAALSETSARAAARAVVYAAAAAWADVRDIAPLGLAIQLRNYRAALDLATISVAGSDLLAYADGALESDAFEARWIIITA